MLKKYEENIKEYEGDMKRYVSLNLPIRGASREDRSEKYRPVIDLRESQKNFELYLG